MVILTIVNKNNYYSSLNNEKIIHLFNNYNNFILDDHDYNYYDYVEYKKFKNYFIEYYYDYNKLISIGYFNYSGNYHREDGPALINYKQNDKINYKGYYYLNGKEYSCKNYVLEIKKLV